LEGLLIALLIAALSSVFGGKNKANQRKRPLNNKPVSGSQKTNARPKQKPAANYSMSYVNTEPSIEKVQHSNIKPAAEITMHDIIRHEEADSENEEVLNIGLSDMQRAVVMAEILDKPLALRKK